MNNPMLSRGQDSRVEDSNHLASLLSRHGEILAAADRFDDVSVVGVPVAPYGGYGRFTRRWGRVRESDDTLVGSRFLGSIDVSGAKCVFLWVDPILDETAVGTEDPPTRAVEPANPAGFDLKEDVVELQHDAPVSRGIDAFPGASVSQPVTRRQCPSPS